MSPSQFSNTEQKIYINDGNAQVLQEVPANAKLGLDIGFGNASNAKVLKKKGIVVDGITISQIEIDNSKDVIRNAYIHNLEQGLPSQIKNEKYDFILMSHVLEHIAYPTNLLKEINEVSTENTKLIIAVPNLFHYKTRIKLMLGEFKYEESGIWDYTHMRWYNEKLLRMVLEQNNFEVKTVKVSGFLPGHSIFNKLLPQSLYKTIINFLFSISKGFFGNQYIVTAVKK